MDSKKIDMLTKNHPHLKGNELQDFFFWNTYQASWVWEFVKKSGYWSAFKFSRFIIHRVCWVFTNFIMNRFSEERGYFREDWIRFFKVHLKRGRTSFVPERPLRSSFTGEGRTEEGFCWGSEFSGFTEGGIEEGLLGSSKFSGWKSKLASSSKRLSSISIGSGLCTCKKHLMIEHTRRVERWELSKRDLQWERRQSDQWAPLDHVISHLIVMRCSAHQNW